MDIQRIEFANEEAWLAMRKHFVGSTEMASLLNSGRSGCMSYYKLWHIKNGSLDDDFKATEYTENGKIMEPAIAQCYANKYGCDVEPYKVYHYNHEYGLASSFDYRITSGPDEDWLLECKNIMSHARRTWETDELPLYFELQGQGQLIMNPEAKGVIFACLVNGWEIQRFVVKRHEGIAESIKKRSLLFWESIENGTEPAVDWSDTGSAQKVHGHSDGTHENADEKQLGLIEELAKLKNSEKGIKEMIEEVKTKLMISTKSDKLLMPTGQYLDLKKNEDSPGKIVTQEMVGQRIGARKGGRRCQIRGNKKD